MERLNRPSDPALRPNRMKTSREEPARERDGRTRGRDGVAHHRPFDAFAHPLWHAGHFMPQSLSSQQIARLVDPQPGERILDLCAAPGGKTTHLAELMRNKGEIVSVERNPDRAEQLRTTCARMG